MSEPASRRSTRSSPNIVNEYENWIKVGNNYFINPPRVWTDEEGNLRCDYAALEMRFVDDQNGFSMHARGLWPPENAFFPYGGGPHGLLTRQQYDNIVRHNLPKYGGDSRTHYLVRYKTGPGINDWSSLDAHPRHARALGYPENCCWPGSRLQTCERGDKKANMVLDRIDEEFGGKFRIKKESYPQYPYIHWPVFAYSTRQIKDGEELLVWYGWSKNALTRFIGREIKQNTGHRKSGDTVSESVQSVIEI